MSNILSSDTSVNTFTSDSGKETPTGAPRKYIGDSGTLCTQKDKKNKEIIENNKKKINNKINYNSRLKRLRIVQYFIRQRQSMIDIDRVSLKSLASCFYPRRNEKKYIYSNNIAENKATIKNLNLCKNPNCVCCGPVKLSEERENITKAVEKHAQDGFSTLMFTMTLSHKKTDDVQELIYDINRAKTKFFQNSAVWKKFTRRYGNKRIYSFEVTYSEKNCIHPHFHCYLFADSNSIDIEYWRNEFYKQWHKILKTINRKANLEHGVFLNEIRPENAKDYITKLALEMTASNFKEGKREGHYPISSLVTYVMQYDDIVNSILRGSFIEDYKSGKFDKEIIKQCLRYMNIYIDYLFACSGSPMIRWSGGTKEHFGINILNDDEVFEKEASKYIDVLEVKRDCFKYLDRHNGKILNYLKNGEYHHVNILLNRIDFHLEAFEEPYIWLTDNMKYKGGG